ncbi:GLE1 protein [Nymphaea thermarum]|nr:GLE1 protein [Nymphaea thermarum]
MVYKMAFQHLTRQNLAETCDIHLSAVQRDHEQRSEIEERKIRKEVASEDARRKEKMEREEKERLEKLQAEVEARMKAEQMKAEKLAMEKAAVEAQKGAQKEAAERAAEEALEKKAAEASQRKAAKEKSRTGGVIGGHPFLIDPVERWPSLLGLNPSVFEKMAKKAKELGPYNGSTMYSHALYAVCTMSEPVWDAKLVVVKEFGWTQEDTMTPFQIAPPDYIRWQSEEETQVLCGRTQLQSCIDVRLGETSPPARCDQDVGFKGSLQEEEQFQ